MVGVGFVSLFAALVVAMLGFLGLRLVVARSSGIGGWRPIVAFDQKPWAGVALWRRAFFTFAGPLGAYFVAVSFFTVGLTLAGELTLDETSMRVNVRPSSPAAEAGIESGDQIVSVDGVEVRTWDELKDRVKNHEHERVDVVVRRDGQIIAIATAPSVEGKIGVMPPSSHRPVGFFSALGRGAVQPTIVIFTAAKNFFRIAFGTSEVAELTGPVGIMQETGKTGRAGLGQLLLLLGSLISYFLLVPLLILSLVFFPRARKTP